MKEFMFLVKNEGDGKAPLTPEQHRQFLKACEVYIEDLVKNGNLKSAQPLIREGIIISGSPGTFRESPVDKTKEIQVGYYHILANDLNEAVDIAKRNPEFAFVKGATVEVRPIKTMEQSTSFVYPGKK